MRSILFAALFVGCAAKTGGGGGGLGESCDLKHACAEGGVCDYTLAAPVCIDSAGDNDGDGIPNATDHCPDGPGGMFDEDNDGIGDDCDKCPVAKPTGVADRDGDDVDSPCDPDPDTAGDKILFFDGFNNPDFTAHWMPDAASAGAWSVEGGELVVRLPTQEDLAYFVTNVIPEPNISVEISYRIDKLETGSVTHQVSASAIDSRPAGVASFDCGVVRSDVSSDEIVDLETDQGNVSHGSMFAAFDDAPLYRSAAYASGNTVGCVVIGDNNPLATVQGGITPDSLGQVRLEARGVTARFQWVLVVGRSNTGTGGS